MHSDGPIALADAAANYFALANYISERPCRCTQMGPLHWRMLLPITLLGPIRFLGGTANALKWAHCISGCCCQLLCFGQLYFWKALLMYSDGPMALVDTAADGFNSAYYFLGGTANALRCAHCIGDTAPDYFTWAHKISVRHFQCIRMEDPNQGTLHLVLQQCFLCVSTVLLYITIH